MALNIKIRPVKAGDHTSLKENIYSRDTIDQVLDIVNDRLELQKKNEGVQLVGEIDGQIVATGLYMRKKHPFHAHRAKLGDMVTDLPYQRKGIARKIIAELERYAKEQGITVMETSARGGTPAEMVYKKLGFTEAGRVPKGLVETWKDGKTYDEVYFYKLI